LTTSSEAPKFHKCIVNIGLVSLQLQSIGVSYIFYGALSTHKHFGRFFEPELASCVTRFILRNFQVNRYQEFKNKGHFKSIVASELLLHYCHYYFIQINRKGQIYKKSVSKQNNNNGFVNNLC